MAMKSSFGCASLQTGSLIIGWLGLLLNIFACFFYFAGTPDNSSIDTPDNSPIDVQHMNDEVNANIPLTIIAFSVTGFVFFAYVSLIHGAYMGYHGFLIPYLLVAITSVGYTVVGIGYTLVGKMLYSSILITPEILIELFFTLAINAYAFCVVYSHYKELKYTAQKTKGTVSFVAV